MKENIEAVNPSRRAFLGSALKLGAASVLAGSTLSGWAIANAPKKKIKVPRRSQYCRSCPPAF